MFVHCGVLRDRLSNAFPTYTSWFNAPPKDLPISWSRLSAELCLYNLKTLMVTTRAARRYGEDEEEDRSRVFNCWGVKMLTTVPFDMGKALSLLQRSLNQTQRDAC
jgi:hypothetical protein